MKTLTAIVAAVTLLGLSTVAQAQPYEPLSVDVRYVDLDLSTDAGRDTLQQRIDRAVHRVCPRRHRRTLADARWVRECAENARTNADQQVAALLAERALASTAIEVRVAAR